MTNLLLLLCLCFRRCQVLEDHSPSSRWRVDTLLSMLGIAGAACDRSIPAAAVVYVSQNEELHAHAAHKTFRMIKVRGGLFIDVIRYFLRGGERGGTAEKGEEGGGTARGGEGGGEREGKGEGRERRGGRGGDGRGGGEWRGGGGEEGGRASRLIRSYDGSGVVGVCWV